MVKKLTIKDGCKLLMNEFFGKKVAENIDNMDDVDCAQVCRKQILEFIGESEAIRFDEFLEKNCIPDDRILVLNYLKKNKKGIRIASITKDLNLNYLKANKILVCLELLGYVKCNANRDSKLWYYNS
jgi:hypothetical protein